MEMTKSELMEVVDELENMLICIEGKLCKYKGVKEGRKEEVLKILKEHGNIKVGDIAKLVGISERNVSSQLSYLRRDGIQIATDSKGRKFIESEAE